MKQRAKAIVPVGQLHGNAGKKRICRSVAAARDWMIEFVVVFGERLPHQKLICINAFKYKTEIYRQMKAELALKGYIDEQLCSPKQFYRMIQDHFPELKVGKVIYCRNFLLFIFILEDSKFGPQNLHPKLWTTQNSVFLSPQVLKCSNL